ncbi:fimbrial protein, partial [Shigella flexneri]|nr:fimbrial protein [Escherichia coli]EFQ0018084.1 fimbrial protein [Shigella flexneri]
MVAKINRLLRLGPVLLLCTSFFAQSNMTVYPMS